MAEKTALGRVEAEWVQASLLPLRITGGVDEPTIYLTHEEADDLRAYLNHKLGKDIDLDSVKKAIELAAKLLLHIDDLFPIARFVLQKEFTNAALAIADATIEVATDEDVSLVKEAADAVRAAL